MAIGVGRCLGTTLWDSSDLGVAPGTAEVRTTITFSILTPMEQVRSLWAST
jgi:hypothetical protein